MENFDFEDKYLKETASNEAMFDNDEIWENIEPKLKKKEKRRPILLFFFGLLLIGGIVFWNYASTSSTLSSAATIMSDDESDKDEKVINAPTKESDKTHNQTVGIINAPIVQKDKGTKLESFKKSKSIVNEASSHSSNNTDFYGKNLLKENVQNTKTQIAKKQAFENPIAENPIAEAQLIENLISENEIGENQNESNHDAEIALENQDAESKNNTESLTESLTQDVEPSIIVLHEDAIQSADDIEEVDEIQKMIEIETRTPLSKEEKVKQRKAAIKKRKAIKEAKEKARNLRKRQLKKPVKSSKWAFDIVASGSFVYAFEKIVGIASNEDDYLTFRNDRVQRMPSYGINLGGRVISPNGLIISSGIEFLQLNERVRREETIIKANQEEVTETILENSQGGVVSSTSSLQLVTTTTTYNQLLNNQYYMLNIPIGVGYRAKLKGVRFNVLGGINYNVYHSFKGSLYNKDKELFKNQSIQRDIYKDHLGIGFWVSGEVEKPITQKLSILLGLGLETPSKSITKSEYFLKQDIFVSKLNLGIKYALENGQGTKRQRKS